MADKQTPEVKALSDVADLEPLADPTPEPLQEHALRTLRNFLRTEPAACRKLFTARQQLEKDTPLSTTTIEILAQGEKRSVSMLGVINGLLQPILAGQKICGVYDEARNLIGFRILDSKGILQK